MTMTLRMTLAVNADSRDQFSTSINVQLLQVTILKANRIIITSKACENFHATYTITLFSGLASLPHNNSVVQ